MKKLVMFPQLFAEGEAAAAPAGGTETAPAAGTETGEVTFRVGDTLADGTKVEDARVAAALTKQIKRHPEMRDVYGQSGAQQPAQQAEEGAQDQQLQQPTIEQRWEELKKGEYKELFGQDVRNAIKDRFKNQANLQQELDDMKPMLDVLMKKSGANSYEELRQIVLNDDSLYEDEAEAAGMTVEQYKHMKELEDEHERRQTEDQQRAQQQMLQQHVSSIRQQAEELRQMFPGFNLDQEMLNPEFVKLTMPGGISVKQAYMALHGDELIPQLMGYGMNRAREQMGQTIQAQRIRPAEGAMSGKSQAAAEPKIDPSKLTRDEMKMYKQMIRKGTFVSFD